MCYDCYKEYGEPRIINERVKESVRLIRTVYDQEGCSVGGYGHIVFDDWNIEDDSVGFCITSAINNDCSDWISEEGQKACLDCLDYFKGLTVYERATALAIVNGFITSNQPT